MKVTRFIDRIPSSGGLQNYIRLLTKQCKTMLFLIVEFN